MGPAAQALGAEAGQEAADKLLTGDDTLGLGLIAGKRIVIIVRLT